MKRFSFALLIIVLLVGVLVFFWNRNGGTSLAPATHKTYASERFEFEFIYPEYYFLEERELGDGHRYHANVMLTEDTEENRLVREGKSPGREGPVAITLDVYQNNLDNLAVIDWIKNTNDSNFKLSDGTFAFTKIGEKPAVSYAWSGLYEADVLVFAHNENIVMLTVTYITREDQIRKDFGEMVRAFKFLVLSS